MHPQDKKRFAATKIEFKNTHNYKYCYVSGKFRLYIYDNENDQKIDVNDYQIMCGAIDANASLFEDFIKTFPYSLPPPEVKEEFNRIGPSLAEAFKKVIGEVGWFRVTFNEMKYIPGDRNLNPKI